MRFISAFILSFLLFTNVAFGAGILDRIAAFGTGGITAGLCKGVIADAEGNGLKLGCQLCDIVKLVDNLVFLLTTIAFGAAVILFVYAGYLIMFYGVNEHFYTQARLIIQGTVVGLVIVLTAYVAINTIFRELTRQGEVFAPWDSIQCTDVTPAAQ